MKKPVLLLITLFIASKNLFGQFTGNAAFLKGNYVEIGIDSLGGFEGAAWDTLSPPLSDLHYRSSQPYFGFVANPQKNSWTNFDGDFFTPGSPENGWGFEVIGPGLDIPVSNNCSDISMIPGSITSYSHIDSITTVQWDGNYAGSGIDLNFTIEYTLYDTALYFLTTVTVQNNGVDTFENFYYYRNMDPDNNTSISYDFTTMNQIFHQPTVGSPIACVSAYQNVPRFSSISFWGEDPAFRVSKGGFENRHGSYIWNGTAGLSLMGTSYADEAISIAYRIQNMIPGMPYTFSFKTIFGNTSMSDFFSGMTEPGISQFMAFPNPFNDYLNIVSGNIEDRFNIQLTDLNGKVLVQKNDLYHTQQLDLSYLPPGIYILLIGNSQMRKAFKVTKE